VTSVTRLFTNYHQHHQCRLARRQWDNNIIGRRIGGGRGNAWKYTHSPSGMFFLNYQLCANAFLPTDSVFPWSPSPPITRNARRREGSVSFETTSVTEKRDGGLSPHQPPPRVSSKMEGSVSFEPTPIPLCRSKHETEGSFPSNPPPSPSLVFRARWRGPSPSNPPPSLPHLKK